MIRTLIISIFLITAASAAELEQCSYSTKNPEGKITQTTEAPSEADGSNQKRFADIKRREEAGEEGWKGYQIFDVNCRPLDDVKEEYHLFVQTENGTISLIHKLTEATCYHSLYAADTHRNACGGRNSCSWHTSGGDFKQGQCFK